MSAASLTLSTIHLFVWTKYRSQPAHLLFFLLAASATAFGAFELAMMQSASAATYASTLRWAHVPLALVVLSIVWFVHFHFGAGRLWLAWAVSGFRLLGLALNFVTGANINFQEVTSLDRLRLWGDAVVVGPVGSANPWAFVPQVGNLLLIVFVVDASVTLWRRGGADARRRAAVVGGGVVACIVAVAGFAALITLGWVHAPTIVMPGVFLIVLAMGYELGWDLIAASQLAQRLRASETRFRAVVESVHSAILLVDRQGLIALANAQAETLFGYKTFIVTGGGQDFVRVYSQAVYGIPPEQVVGTAAGTSYGYAKDGKPFLTKTPKLLLNDNNAGKPEGIHLMIGRRPNAAFGNSTGDMQMLQWTKAGDGARLSMILLHDDAKREYAYGPAQGLPATKVGAFTQALCDQAKKEGWTVISMKDDWKKVFAFD